MTRTSCLKICSNSTVRWCTVPGDLRPSRSTTTRSACHVSSSLSLCWYLSAVSPFGSLPNRDRVNQAQLNRSLHVVAFALWPEQTKYRNFHAEVYTILNCDPAMYNVVADCFL
jgi:hypothetical protein